MHVKLRQAAPEDFGTVLDLLSACGLHTSSVTPQGSTYWIADLDGRPSGCIGLEHGEQASLLRSMGVLPAARRQGLGRALALSALTYASLRGDAALYLFSSDAGAFWQQFGFVPVDAAEVAAALPGTPQVQSGECKGWIHQEQAWKRVIGA
ncbi:GNAT family N-acetyltransferase [Deinococcus irradiatisoli]|uniref:GNAT family N-acetyltransferase n=2 Tax=Deinococcus irradiatisoli TaxID=2202254 RepID=A0A2Z3JH86_9DEIO|nr:GNAT family N-acetyltransferase [Deinococcus irradiatisoli]AWN24547.1 GNAT family N-acetyltransferase [Deinococcus irradiatisoli]